MCAREALFRATRLRPLEADGVCGDAGFSGG
jgi:hypothetical protein